MSTAPTPGRTRYLLGLDLGQAQDYSALAVIERQKLPAQAATYAVRQMQRWELRTPYGAVVKDVRALLHRKPLAGRATLVVDGTGVGAAVVEQFETANLPGPMLVVHIHGGDKVSREQDTWRVPKHDLAGVLAVLLQGRRLHIVPSLELAQTLAKELANFRVTIDPKTAHESFAAWRERDHDDLVLAVALACWAGENVADESVLPDSVPFQDVDPLGGGSSVPTGPSKMLQAFRRGRKANDEALLAQVAADEAVYGRR